MICWGPIGESANSSLSLASVYFDLLSEVESARLVHSKAPFLLVINKCLVQKYFETLTTLNSFNSPLSFNEGVK